MELLFETRLDIAKVEGKLYWFQARPRISEEPVIRPDTAVDRTGAAIYGSVLYDEGRYRMWYQAWPEDWDGGDVSLVAYAESDDGQTWRKPDLGIVDRGGTKNNLCNLGFQCPSVFIDPDADATHRYRACGYTRPGRVGSVAVERPGYYTAHSADGLSWTLDGNEPVWDGGDVITSVYHPVQKRAVVALKHSPRAGGIPRRSIYEASFTDGQWTGATAALIPDAYDDVTAIGQGFASGDYYGMGMMPAGSGTVGFIWQFRHDLPRTAGSGAGVFGVEDISLCYQGARGDRWLHAFGRKNFISHDDVPWGPGGIVTASNVIAMGEVERLYFDASMHSHGWYLSDTWQRIEKRKAELISEGMARIGYAEWPAGRLFGFRADPEGVLELRVDTGGVPGRFFLNGETDSVGSIKLEIPGLDGYGADRARALTGDHLRAAARWEHGELIKPKGVGPMTVRIHLERARLYSFAYEPAR